MREAALAYRAAERALDFPISPGFDSKPPRLSPTEHLQWCEQVIKNSPRAQIIFSSPALVEFVL